MFTWHSHCLSVCAQMFPFCKDISPYRLGDHPLMLKYDFILTNELCLQPCFQIRSCSMIPGSRDSTAAVWGTAFNPWQASWIPGETVCGRLSILFPPRDPCWGAGTRSDTEEALMQGLQVCHHWSSQDGLGTWVKIYLWREVGGAILEQWVMCRRITEHQALNLPGIAGEVIHKMPPAPSACHTLQTSVKFKYDSLLSDTRALWHYCTS